MKWTHGVGFSAVVMAVSAAAWLGCGDDSSTTGGTDGGGSDGGGSDALVQPDGQGSDAGEGGDSAGGTDAGLSCAVYCDQVVAHCTSDPGTHPPHEPAVDAGNQQYNSKAGCLAECAKMKLGTITDTAGDTVACRQYHSGAPAVANPKLHCPHAGPSGGGVCSAGDAGTDRCATFCGLALQLCVADAGIDPANVPFTSLSDCMNKCGTAAYTFNTAKPELMFDGKDLNCRQYHLEAASEGMPASGNTHCPHLRDDVSSPCN